MVASATELIRITQIYSSAVYAVMVWDWILCATREWKSIWMQPWCVVKVLYIFSRYWTLAALGFSLAMFTMNISHGSCSRVVNLIPAACGVVTVTTEGILAMRCFAIYERARWVGCLIATLFCMEMVFLVWASVEVKSALPPGIVGPCLPTSTSGGKGPNFAYFLSPFIVDSILTGLSLYKAVSLAKDGTVSAILRIFIRDGLMYFLVTAAVNLISAAFYLQPVAAMQSINAFASLGLSSLMCCRLVLSLRGYSQASKQVAVRYADGTQMQSKHGRQGVFRLGNPIVPILAKQDIMIAQDYGLGTPAHDQLSKEVSGFTTPPKKARTSFHKQGVPFDSVDSFDSKQSERYSPSLEKSNRDVDLERGGQ